MCNSNDTPKSNLKNMNQIPRTFVSERKDGRFISSTGFIHAYIKNLKQKLQFTPDMTKNEFYLWRDAVRVKLLELMCFPEFENVQPSPKCIWCKKRKGYMLQKWEAYPEPYSIVPFLVLIPEGVNAESPAPGVMCFPGSFSSKESMCEELELNGEPCDHRYAAFNRMALEYARQGIVSVAVENPATNELSDPIRQDSYEFSVHCMWAGRCYESVSVFQKYHILQWLKQQPYVDASRIAASGHSLGAKPALILGLLDQDVKAVVWNDVAIDWRERAVATNLTRIGTFQYVPGMLQWFDYSDLQAALAPEFLLIAEGGRTETLNKIQKAYKLAGQPEHFQFAYYPKYADVRKRLWDSTPLPEGLSMEEYFPYANIDAAGHHFKGEVAVSWLKKTL